MLVNKYISSSATCRLSILEHFMIDGFHSGIVPLPLYLLHCPPDQ